jgi:hypothetical protein
MCIHRAHDYLNLAERLNPECHFIHFTRFKVYLEQHDTEKAAQQLKRMISLPDCDIHILRVSGAARHSCISHSFSKDLVGLTVP